MRVRRTFWIAVACTALLALPAGASAAARTYLIPDTESQNSDGSWPARYKPSFLPFAQDGTLYMTGVRWYGWNSGRAIGHGTAHQTSCTPSCAQGQTQLIRNAWVVANRRTNVDGYYVYEGLWIHGTSRSPSMNWAMSPMSFN